MKLSTSSVTFSGVYIFNGPNLASFSFFKNTSLPVSFFFIFVFSMQLTVNVNYNFLLMTGFEPWTAGVGSNHSNNWATNTAQTSFCLFSFFTPDKYSINSVRMVGADESTELWRHPRCVHLFKPYYTFNGANNALSMSHCIKTLYLVHFHRTIFNLHHLLGAFCAV